MSAEKIVRADECAIGSTVTRDVTDDKGAVVCFAGDRLNASLLLRLKRAGITTVYVDDGTASESESNVREQLAELDRRFGDVDANPIMRVMKETIAERMKESAGGGV
jgi:hypothetical protein